MHYTLAAKHKTWCCSRVHPVHIIASIFTNLLFWSNKSTPCVYIADGPFLFSITAQFPVSAANRVHCTGFFARVKKKNNEWMNEMNCGSITLEEMWNGVRRKKNGCLRRKLRRRTAFSADRRPLSAACLFLRWKPAIECTGSFKGVTRRGSYSTLSEILPAVCRGSVHTLRTMRLPCRNKSWVQCGIKGKG